MSPPSSLRRGIVLEQLLGDLVHVLVALLGARLEVQVLRGDASPHNLLRARVDDVDSQHPDHHLLDSGRVPFGRRVSTAVPTADLEGLTHASVVGDQRVGARVLLNLPESLGRELSVYCVDDPLVDQLWLPDYH